jgi:outer membrane lipoprotein-sorting protein
VVIRCKLLIIITILSFPAHAQSLDAGAILQAAMDHWRGTTSYSELTMTIHREDWERSMSMRIWTQGDETSLVRVTEPRKDAGNSTLLKDTQMWTFSPRVNRVLKVPSSMMNQSWMGSDFSNKDVSRSTDILREYDHTLLETLQVDGHTVYVIEGIPHEEAAVVWGKEILHVRDDYVLLEEQFWDQDGELVKSMRALEVQEMSGRTVATHMRMQKRDSPQEWTEIKVRETEFNLQLSPELFTLSYLRNPRQ